MGFDDRTSDIQTSSQPKKRRISPNGDIPLCDTLGKLGVSLPILQSPDYYIFPSFKDLSTLLLKDPGYTSRVSDFIVGRFGFGSVKFFGKTDVRRLELDKIVKFRRHEVIVYEDENAKPVVGQGLNKPAEVTLQLQLRKTKLGEKQLDGIVKRLRKISERQGAHFISFDLENCEWKFSVNHFSRFGFSEDDEEDIIMDDSNAMDERAEVKCSDISDIDQETQINPIGPVLCHSLPAHLGLDPVKMKEMKILMFAEEEEEVEAFDEFHNHHNPSFDKEHARLPLQHSIRRISHKSSPPMVRKTPLALLEYNHGSLDTNPSGTILMSQQNKGISIKPVKAVGFRLDLTNETPVAANHSRNIVDAGLFMGRSFRVGWGPNGILVHSGMPVGCTDSRRVLSSVVNLEKVAFDKVVRDENNKVREELVDFCFNSPLNLHKEMDHETEEVEVGSFKLKLQKIVTSRFMLSDICRSYVDIIERQTEIPGLSPFICGSLTHQIMVWELVKVLFSERENIGRLRSLGDDDEEEMMQNVNEISPQVDLEALPLIRRAEFSCWLQECVVSCVQDDISSLNDYSYLEHIRLLLTGRQLDTAVELAASRGDVRLACLLSQAGGSTVNRSDVARQLDLWQRNGMDFSFIEKERIQLYELLAGNIHGALHDIELDWRRFLGLLMWYNLPPDSSLPSIFHTYQQLLDNGRAPYPVPLYADRSPRKEVLVRSAKDCFDISYFLMLLHASGDAEFGSVKAMFSAFSSTNDPLDHHMIWHQRAVLEAVGATNSSDLNILDMGLVSQLLCLGQCHWAIYVVLHMPFREDFPYLHAKVIREILFQYCESWSSQESQFQFIENMGVPSVWLHEAMAVYFSYCGDMPKALEHFIECEHWPRAHTIFVTSVAHTLFLSAQHPELWKIATSMEDHKPEIENWDLGAGLYISFYSLRSALQENDNTMTEMDSLESRNDACGEFFGRLKVSLAIWGDKLPIDARAVYSKMAEEISGLLLSDIGEGSTCEFQLRCFDTVFSAPIPEDLRSCHLQDAASLFTCFLSETAS